MCCDVRSPQVALLVALDQLAHGRVVELLGIEKPVEVVEVGLLGRHAIPAS